MPDIFWIWMAAAVVFLIIELASPTLIFISFVIGSLAGGVLSYFRPDELVWQIGLFVVVSLIILPFSQRMARKITKEAPLKSNADRMIGEIALVTKEIDPDLGGQVKYEGELWQARATETIASKEKVRILTLSGTHVTVERLQS